ncbi:MAG: hypothetical protein WCQ53_03115 [bacterium]
MLTELYSLMFTIVPIIMIGAVFAADIDTRLKNELAYHDSIKNLFFSGSCSKPINCEADKISSKGMYSIKLRKPSKAFSKKGEEVKDDALEGLYRELEKAAQGNTNK